MLQNGRVASRAAKRQSLARGSWREPWEARRSCAGRASPGQRGARCRRRDRTRLRIQVAGPHGPSPSKSSPSRQTWPRSGLARSPMLTASPPQPELYRFDSSAIPSAPRRHLVGCECRPEHEEAKGHRSPTLARSLCSHSSARAPPFRGSAARPAQSPPQAVACDALSEAGQDPAARRKAF